MKVKLYLQGEVTPLLYDYDLDADGVLIPSRRPKERNADTLVIVIERGLDVPTKGQSHTLKTISAINPTWPIETFFTIHPRRKIKREIRRI
jgi:hypothetical protein